MKKIITLLTIVVMCLAPLSIGFAQEIFYEGEGYIVPSEISLDSVDYEALARRNGNSNTVVVNIDSNTFPDVILYSTVLDATGVPVSGLTQNNFTLAEQSTTEAGAVNEVITCFSEGTTGAGISFGLVFDLSTSMDMDGRLTDAKAAAIEFFNNTAAADRGAQRDPRRVWPRCLPRGSRRMPPCDPADTRPRSRATPGHRHPSPLEIPRAGWCAP